MPLKMEILNLGLLYLILFQLNYGLTFDHTLAQQAEVTSWDNTPPCIIKPHTCTNGTSVLAWLKMAPNCPSWGGIFGSVESGAEGLIVVCENSGTAVE